jgi:VIT1/CCC1 family predicted Fe2+/Mn2+ transporter
MALTFTMTSYVAGGGREDVRTLLFAVVGCNLAWGLVDAVMFLMNELTGRGRDLVTVRAVREAASAGEAHGIITEAIGPLLSSILTADDLERVRLGLTRLEDLPAGPRLKKEDWLGALGVFLLVFLSTFPIVLPFLLFSNVRFGLRVSNLVAIAMLAGCGYTLARHGGHRPLTTAAIMVGVGLVLVAITIALGG